METNKINPRVYGMLPKSAENMQEVTDSVSMTVARDILTNARNCYDSLNTARADRRRYRKYAFAKDNGQWSDLLPDGSMTEAEHISRQGKTPSQYNLIQSALQTILGQFCTNQTEPVCSARDRNEQTLGEMMTIAMQSIYQVNSTWELDISQLVEMLLSGIGIYKTTFGYIPALQKTECKEEAKALPRMFFNPYEDVRGWDIRIIGEIHDMKMADVISEFSNGDRRRALELRHIYESVSPRVLEYYYGNMDAYRSDMINFFTPQDPTLCRVIEVWTMESKEKLWCHDTLEGRIFYTELNQQRSIIEINKERQAQADRFGIEAKLINFKWDIHRYWYYRFFAPTGEILAEGQSPYWHGSHPYSIRKFFAVDGEAHSFVKMMMDAQHMLNRSLTLIDFIIGASSKGTLMIPETVLGKYTPEQFAAEYRKVGGYIVFTPDPKLPDGGIPQEISSNARSVGVSEMVSLIRSLMPDISGVHEALQGQKANAGTSGVLYQAEAQQAATNLVYFFEVFRSLREDRDIKAMKVVQQYWTSPRYIDTAGKQYSNESKYWNPKKVANTEFDLSLNESTASASYRDVVNNWLMELWKSQAISVKTLLSNSTLPFADKVLQSIETEEEQMMGVAN